MVLLNNLLLEVYCWKDMGLELRKILKILKISLKTLIFYFLNLCKIFIRG